MRQQVERRRKNRQLELESTKKKKMIKLTATKNVSVDETMKKYILDHNGKMIQKNSLPIKYDALPAFFRKGLNHTVKDEDVKVSRIKVPSNLANADDPNLKTAKSGAKITTKLRTDKLVLGLKQQEMLASEDLTGPLDDHIELKYGVKMVTSTGEHRVGKPDHLSANQSMMYTANSRRYTVGTTVRLSIFLLIYRSII